MPITTPVASAVVREVLKMKAAEEESSSGSKLSETQVKALKSMKKGKVMFAGDHLLQGEDEFIGWWATGTQPATTKDILLSELVNVTRGWASRYMNSIDNSTASVIISLIGQIHLGAETATGKVPDETYKRFSDAWKAGAYSAAIGTDHEFTMFAEDMVIGGPIYMKLGLETITGSTARYPKEQFFNLMGHAEREDGQHGIKTTKEYAENGRWKFILPLTP